MAHLDSCLIGFCFVPPLTLDPLKCRVVSESILVFQIRFCFPKLWKKEINQPYAMQLMFPSTVTLFDLSLFCFVLCEINDNLKKKMFLLAMAKEPVGTLLC